jgi:hypothetical protein
MPANVKETAQAVAVTEAAHSTLIGGSICERRMNCLASYGLEIRSPEQPSSEYAKEGTMLHSVMDIILGEGKTVSEMLGYEEDGHVLTEELAEEMVEPALALLDELFKEYGADDFEYVTEARVHYSGMDAFGTCDIIGVGGGYTFVVDWKFGRGVPVRGGRNNSQLKFYAGAARSSRHTRDMFDRRREIVLAIIQPGTRDKLTHGTISNTELTQFVVEMKEAVGKNLTEKEPPTAGKWCKWCRAQPTCPAKTSVAEQLRAKPPIDASIDPDELGRLLDTAHEMEEWIGEVCKAAMNELEKGRDVTGWKLVEGRATRKWSDEGKAEALLKKYLKKKAYTEPKLISPAQAEKALKATNVDLEPLIVSHRGTTMAPADDSRPAIKVAGRAGGNLNLPAR